jgi:hypothetical protein
MGFEWTDPAPPANGDPSFYDHVIAETPLGEVVIEWKSWKDYPDYVCQTPWETFVCGETLEEAKIAVESSLLHLQKDLYEFFRG